MVKIINSINNFQYDDNIVHDLHHSLTEIKQDSTFEFIYDKLNIIFLKYFYCTNDNYDIDNKLSTLNSVINDSFSKYNKIIKMTNLFNDIIYKFFKKGMISNYKDLPYIYIILYENQNKNTNLFFEKLKYNIDNYNIFFNEDMYQYIHDIYDKISKYSNLIIKDKIYCRNKYIDKIVNILTEYKISVDISDIYQNNTTTDTMNFNNYYTYDYYHTSYYGTH